MPKSQNPEPNDPKDQLDANRKKPHWNKKAKWPIYKKQVEELSCVW